MTYQVFVRQTAGSGFLATPLPFPGWVAAGKTRDEALVNLRSMLDARLADGEIVLLEVGEPDHSWLRGAGIFKEDPAFDDFLAEVETYRREVDAAEITLQ